MTVQRRAQAIAAGLIVVVGVTVLLLAFGAPFWAALGFGLATGAAVEAGNR